jgi:hypothetical protein
MLSVNYAECRLCWVSFMLCVSNKFYVLSAVMLNVIMLTVIMLSVIMLSAVMLNVIMLTVIMLSVSHFHPSLIFVANTRSLHQMRVPYRAYIGLAPALLASIKLNLKWLTVQSNINGQKLGFYPIMGSPWVGSSLACNIRLKG